MSACGCEIVGYQMEGQPETLEQHMAFCPLHANAEELKEALLTMLKYYKDTLKNEHSATPTREYDPDYFKSLDLIAACKEKP